MIQRLEVAEEPNYVYITTFSGTRINAFDPDPSTMLISDIAHSLSLICRWNGQIREFYSVAQHSIMVSHLCDPEDAMIGLLHDAGEAYLGDLVNPVKHLDAMVEYVNLEKKYDAAIAKSINLPSIEKTPSVELADKLALVKEAKMLSRPIPTKYVHLLEKWEGILDAVAWKILTPREAELAFLKRFDYLWNKFELWQKR